MQVLMFPLTGIINVNAVGSVGNVAIMVIRHKYCHTIIMLVKKIIKKRNRQVQRKITARMSSHWKSCPQLRIFVIFLYMFLFSFFSFSSHLVFNVLFWFCNCHFKLHFPLVHFFSNFFVYFLMSFCFVSVHF